MQILYFYGGNRKSYSCLCLAQRVTRYMDSDNEPIEGHKGNRESYFRYYFAEQVTKNMDSNYDPIDGRK